MGFSIYAVGWVLLAVVLGLAAWLLRRAEPPAGRVLLRVPLEPRRSVYVLELAGRHLVLGSSEGGVQLLAELDAEAAARLAPALVEEAPLAALIARWTRA